MLTERDIEKNFTEIKTVFNGKESEHNWEKRDASLKTLDNLLSSDNVEDFKDILVRNIHNEVVNFIKSIHSLRSSFAFTGLLLVSTIANTLGTSLDHYTIECILGNLIKCSAISKKVVATKLLETTNIFVSNIKFYPKIMIMFCKTMDEKNIQIRTMSCNNLLTILNTHGRKEAPHKAINNSDSALQLHPFLKKCMTDASFDVRDASKLLFHKYEELFPKKAELLFKSLDSSTQKALKGKLVKKPSFVRNNSISVPTPSPSPSSSSSSSTTSSRSSSFLSKSSVSTRLSSITSKQSITRPSNTNSTTIKSATARLTNAKATITTPATAKPATVRSATVRPSNIRSINTDTTTTVRSTRMSVTRSSTHTRLNNTKATTTKSSPLSQEKEDTQSASNLLKLLNEEDTNSRCEAIRSLSERLKTMSITTTTKSPLPNNIPKKIDLLPILMEYLTNEKLDIHIYETLMSWESIAGIFTHVFLLNHFAPTLIIADEQHCRATLQQQNQIFEADSRQVEKRKQMYDVYSKGLKRIKTYLKRMDPLLAKKLLTIMQSSISIEKELLDASVKLDLQLNPEFQNCLEVGLLKWMNELICDYIGLSEDDDSELVEEGLKFVELDDITEAEQWFEVGANTELYVSFIIDRLLVTPKGTEKHAVISSMVRNIKIANQKAFELKLESLDKDQVAVVNNALFVDIIASVASRKRKLEEIKDDLQENEDTNKRIKN